MKECISISSLFDLQGSVAGEKLAAYAYPWEALSMIRTWIEEIGPTLDPALYDHNGDHVYIAKSAHCYDSVYIGSHCIIGEHAEIRHGAFIRQDAIIGEHCVVGNSCELKNVILFDHCEVPHFNYVGDSILGVKAHMGAGSITSNIKADKKNIRIHTHDQDIETGLRKIGAMLGDGVEIGCNAVLNPGTIIGPRSAVYPTCCVRGVIPSDAIVDDRGQIKAKRA